MRHGGRRVLHCETVVKKGLQAHVAAIGTPTKRRGDVAGLQTRDFFFLSLGRTVTSKATTPLA